MTAQIIFDFFRIGIDENIKMRKGYLKKIRSSLGNAKFIYPGARIIIENEQGAYLFIERRDNGSLGLPAGGMEEDETIESCIIREVREETGLLLRTIHVIGISSDPNRETVQYPNGDETQYFTIEFYSNDYEGKLAIHTEEAKSIKFLSSEAINFLPENEKSTFESLGKFKSTGQITLK